MAPPVCPGCREPGPGYALSMAEGAHTDDREWTPTRLERSFFSTIGRGYLLGIVIFGLFGFVVIRTQAPEWGVGAAIGVGVFAGFWGGVLGAVGMIGRWASRNEELIRGNETGHDHSSDASDPGPEGTTPGQGVS